MQVDNPEIPLKLDHLLEALGAESIPYLNKLACCGAGTRNTDMDAALGIAHEKIIGAELANADALVTVCPTCYVSYDIGQRLMAKNYEKTNLPVFFYAELLGLAMGLDFTTGFKMHTIKVDKFLEKVST
jgi:heterodisulfide reductase subunit B